MTRHIVTHSDGTVDEIRQTWRTPPAFARVLVERYGITLDVAAHAGNAIVPSWLGPGSPIAVDALRATSWGYLAPHHDAAFCNPPFRRALDFVRAGINATTHRARPLRTLVFLLPCNLDTRWARLLWEHRAEFFAITGRLRFAPPLDEHGDPIPGIAPQKGAAFPMCVVHLDGARARARAAGIDGPKPPLRMMTTQGVIL